MTMGDQQTVRARAMILGFSAAILVAANAAAQSEAEEDAIRAGRTIAVTTCISCHVVSPNQSIQPVLGPDSPSFADVASRPDLTIGSLTAAMKTVRLHDPTKMANLSDREWAQAAAYILSLRAAR